MEILEYFGTENKEYWLDKMKESDWGAGRYLYKLLKSGTLKQLVGENTRVLMLTDGNDLVSFCTLAEKDDIQPTDLTPWIGFVYTFPQYRGHRHFGKLLAYGEALAKAEGKTGIYISTNHIGLYEKYGCEFFKTMKDIEGNDSRVYVKRF
ncbi:MAG: GNAT family N-acetyltransferase [Clostridiales bacterium]|nr:GNAT family N-acetyltransferase [Clostridiales bacterium]